MSIAPKATIRPQVDRTLDLIRALRADLGDMESQYLWAKNIAYLERSKNRNPEQGRASKRVRADPTGEQAASMESALKGVRQFEKHLHSATLSYWYKLIPAYEALHRVFEAVDRAYEPTDQRLVAAGIKLSELKKARRAQARRTERGEGWGTG